MIENESHPVLSINSQSKKMNEELNFAGNESMPLESPEKPSSLKQVRK